MWFMFAKLSEEEQQREQRTIAHQETATAQVGFILRLSIAVL